MHVLDLPSSLAPSFLKLVHEILHQQGFFAFCIHIPTGLFEGATLKISIKDSRNKKA